MKRSATPLAGPAADQPAAHWSAAATPPPAPGSRDGHIRQEQDRWGDGFSTCTRESEEPFGRVWFSEADEPDDADEPDESGSIPTSSTPGPH
ncbi:hypothetical protein [Streptomyces sp. NPDC001787]|uniref:hypothetical protein n=1 Tax=Streptomyces sp. NPDC001787 TaxID=3154523 RepID=UPI00332FDCCE